MSNAKYNHRTCFLCGGEISGQAITDEHIFADGFLNRFGLKNKQMDFGANRPIKYSQIKVPAHSDCNNREGSFFESYILDILETMNQNAPLMAAIEFERNDPVSLAVKDALLHWLAKIYYGLIFWELGMKNHPKPQRKEHLSNLTDDFLLSKIQSSFVKQAKFNVPSTLFWFDAPADDFEKSLDFNFSSNHDLKSIYVKFGTNVLVACIGDCNLVSEWFGRSQYDHAQQYLRTVKNGPNAYIDVVSKIWAVRGALPVSPKFIVGPEAIIDVSRQDKLTRPDIDEKLVRSNAATFREYLVSR